MSKPFIKTGETRCDNCVFWHAYMARSDGECRAKTPAVDPSATLGQGQWPRTEPAEWCGHFQPEGNANG